MTTNLTYWLKKKEKKIHVFEVTIFFENVALLSVSRSSLQTLSLDDLFLINFTLPNSNILLEDLIRWKGYFEIFLIDHSAGDIATSIISWFIQYMYYSSACNEGLFKSYYCYVLFLSFKKLFKYYEKYF